MAQTKRQIEEILRGSGMHPRHRFGQNFMIDANLVRLIAEAGEIQPGDLVLEVGPGTGTLTEELLQRVGPDGRVLGVEIDRDLAASLGTRFAADARFVLIEGDAMAGKHGLAAELAHQIAEARRRGTPARLVANLPYNIASPLVIELLLAGIDLLAFTVQKEVADRLRAGPEQGREYGALSIVVQTLAEVQILRKIPAEAFWPRPKIESALVRLRRREPDARLAGRERDFGRFVTGLFTMRRKTLRKALAGIIPGATASQLASQLASAGLSGEERPEQVDPGALRQLYLAGPAPLEASSEGSMIAS